MTNVIDTLYRDILLMFNMKEIYIRRILPLNELWDDIVDVVQSVKTGEILEEFEYYEERRPGFFNPEEDMESLYMHCIKTCVFSINLGVSSGLNDQQLCFLGLSSFLHDIGKRYTPPEILHKNGKLDDSELSIMRMHPMQGASFLKMAYPDCPGRIQQLVLEHHEKLDGTGYPMKKCQNELDTMQQILTIADIYDAYTSKRAYHSQRSREDGIIALEHTNGINQNIVQLMNKDLLKQITNNIRKRGN